MREDVRRTRVVMTPPSHLGAGDRRPGLRMAGEMSEQQAFRIFLSAQSGELYRRDPVGTNRLRWKRALDHREGLFALAHRIELTGRRAPRARGTE